MSKNYKKLNLKKLYSNLKDKKYFLKMRAILLYILAGLSYFMSIYWLLFEDKILPSVVAILIFFGLFHFVFLEFHKKRVKYLAILLGLLTLIEILIVGFQNLQTVISIIILNLGIVLLTIRLDWESNEKRIFRSWWYFTVGGYVFSVCISIAYSLFLIGGKTNFVLDCDVLNNASNKFVDYFAKPFKLWIQEVKTVKDKIWNFFDTDFSDVLNAWKELSSVNNYSSPDLENSENSLIQKTKSQLSSLQNKIDTMLQDNTVVNLGICEFLVNQIKEKANNPIFQFSVLVLMFLVLMPFVRIAFRTISIISYLLFKVLFWLKVYKIRKVQQEVEELY